MDLVDQDADRYLRAMQVIVEDPEIQGGAATFKGTRILVHQIADLLSQGVVLAEIREDYPRLTGEMIDAAPIYARANPSHGRAQPPGWRGGAVLRKIGVRPDE